MSYEQLAAFDCEFGKITEICGVDEAGRGPLAGPVFAAAVVLRPEAKLPRLNDSKKLSEKRREELFEQLTGGAAWFGIGSATVEEIETVNILRATFLAMNRAYTQLAQQLEHPPILALVDGNRDPGLPLNTELLVKGDSRSAVVAAASVLAKVSRDRYMLELHERYPQYDFAKHKGYGTAAHYAALAQYGLCPEHRPSFLKKITG